MEETTTALHPISKIIQHISLWLLMVFTFIFPIAFNPFTLVNPYDFPKWVIVSVVSILLLIFSAAFMVLEKKIITLSNSYLIPVGAFILALLISVFFTPSADSLPTKLSLFFGKAGILLGLVLILYNGLVIVREKLSSLFMPLILSAFVLSWFEILAFLEILPKIFRSQLFAQKTFTPLGSPLILATFLVVTLVMLLIYAFKAEETHKKVLLFVMGGVQMIALVFAVSQILPGQPAAPRLLPYATGWSVLLDQLKNSQTAFFGVGADSFATAFSKFRPVGMNQTANWFMRYNSSSNEWFTLFTTLGLVGVSAFAFMILSFIRGAFKAKGISTVFTAGGLGLLLTVLMITLIPANIALYFLLFILAIMVIGADEDKIAEYDQPALPLAIGIVVLGLVAFLGLNVGKATIAEAHFSQSAKYATENRGNDTYYSQIEAIKANPYAVRYRIAYSNTNLALANSLATKENLTDEDRTMITQLVTQSIREAKAAVALDPQNSNNWTNLANIYRQLINFAQGADQWAVASYVQAIRLDSTNPQLRLDLGGLLYSLGDYESAIDQFKQAISLKPDFPNAYYNLSHAYAKLQQYPQSYAAMQNVVGLIDPNTADHEKAMNELKQLQELLPKEARTATPTAQRESELNEPEPVPTPMPEQLQLDEEDMEELEPPVDEETGFGEIINEDEAGGDQNQEASGSAEGNTEEEGTE